MLENLDNRRKIDHLVNTRIFSSALRALSRVRSSVVPALSVMWQNVVVASRIVVQDLS